jgi:hypothetical protein
MFIRQKNIRLLLLTRLTIAKSMGLNGGARFCVEKDKRLS